MRETMQRPQTLLAALFLGIAFAPHSGATVYHSDGSAANVQAIHDTNAHDGDTITLPAGTFIWITRVTLTKGITVSGQTTITGAGTANCTANDQTIIVDEKLRVDTRKSFGPWSRQENHSGLRASRLGMALQLNIGGDGAIRT